ncbi:MAG: TolC family protein [Candidatus Synoicihabitans palmerolidicus]|nr:TolC family protein [Candidatus Synoicihabitans palmerolidicus]
MCLVATVLLASGCAHRTATPLVKPTVVVDAFNFAHPMPPSPATASDAAWWTTYGSDELNTLVDRALSGSFSLAQACARVEKAAAVVARNRGLTRPELSGEFGAAQDLKRNPKRDDALELSLNATWEVDIFSRLQAGQRGWQWSLLAERERYAVSRLAVVAVDAYYGIVAQRQLLDLITEQRETAQAVLHLVERRFEQGLISRLDVLQQKGQVAEIATLFPPVQRELQTLQTQLDVLAGQAPFTLGEVGVLAEFPMLSPMAVWETPAGLLQSRPDLRAVRAEVMAADEELAAAVADR